MPLQIIHQDITRFVGDAIVNPTDMYFSGSGGTDRAVHRAAGKELDAACAGLPALNTGDVLVTDAFRLPCRYIIHTVGPVWKGGALNEAVLLRSCYMNALFRAVSLGAETVAFPLIASGAFGFPKDAVLRIATDAVSDFLMNSEKELLVTICITDRSAFTLGRESALGEYLGSRQAPRPVWNEAAPLRAKQALPSFSRCADDDTAAFEICASVAAPCGASSAPELSAWIRHQDDSFAVTLLKLIDRKGMTDVQCYKKANVSRKTFYKINNDPDYRPSKATVLAFAIALELSLEETEQLLRTVGFSLSHSNKFDLIIEFYIANGIYDIFEINSALYQYDQVCLGC